MIKYSFLQTNILMIFFLVNSIWPDLFRNLAYQTVFSVFVVIATLLLYFFSLGFQLTYKQLLLKGAQIGLITGFFLGLFFYLYTTYIDKLYFEHLAEKMVSEYSSKGYDDFTIRKMIVYLGTTRKYHINEISTFISSIFKNISIALIIAPFFTRKENVTIG